MRRRLVEAADGHQALVAVRAERPDLVITDVLMPVMDGSIEVVGRDKARWGDNRVSDAS